MRCRPRPRPWLGLLVLLLCVPLPAAAEGGPALAVQVVDEAGKPVADAVVVLVDTDDTAFTGADGRCALPGASPWPHTFYVTAAGFKEKRQEVASAPAGGSIRIVLQVETVQMEAVVVAAENPNPQPTATAQAFSREDMARYAAAGDPTALADFAPGAGFPFLVLSSGSPTGSDLPASPGTRSRLYGRGGASVYGADPDLDAYAFGGIDLPLLRHPLTGRSVLPVGALEGLTAYRGIGPVSRLPSAGSLYVLHPAADPPSRPETSVGLAFPGSLDFLGRYPLSKDSGLTVSLRKSFQEAYGSLWAGALGASDASKTDMLLGGGDLLVSWLTRQGDHEVRLDAVGFYDAAVESPKGTTPDVAASLLSPGSALAPGADWLGCAGLGAVWNWEPGGTLSNSLSAYASAYGARSRLASYDAASGTYAATRTAAASAWAASLSDAVEWAPTDDFSVSGGLRMRYGGLAAEWNGTSVAEGASVLLAYPYAQLRWRSGNLFSQSGAGLYWLPLTGLADLGPALSQEISLFLPPGWFTGLRAAWGSGLYGDSAYLSRRLTEAALSMAASSATTISVLPKAVTVEAFLQNDFSPDLSASLKPFFAWRYDLRGYSAQASWVEESSGTRTLRYLSAREGCAAGCDLTVQGGGEPLRWSAGYTLGWSLLRTVEADWVSANGDARHTLRARASWKPTADFQAAAGLLILEDLPRTASGGAFNAARDLLPRQRVDLGVQWDLRLGGFSGTVHAGATNVLCFLNPVTDAAGAAVPAAAGGAPFGASVGSAAVEFGASLKL